MEYCVNSRGGGWTLVLKVDGSMSTFTYGSQHWITNDTLNPTSLDLSRTEAKFDAFNTQRFTAVRIDFVDPNETGTPTRAVIVPIGDTSMLSLMQHGYTATSLHRAGWTALMRNPSLQPNCNREGFDAQPDAGDSTSVRIGILGNDTMDCLTPDSAIGIGIDRSLLCGPPGTISAGDIAGCGADHGDVLTPVFAYVFVR
jgi:hypothetical protein